MTEVDQFINIANNQISKRKELLQEIEPNIYIKKYFINSNTNDLVEFKEKTYEEELSEYYNGLNELKNKFKPFLIRYAKKVQHENKKIFIENFKYTFEDEKIYSYIKIPHYHGPVGRWTSTYETTVNTSNLDISKATYIVFKGIDYYADIYINNNHIKYHEGFFATFECDISKYIGKTVNLKIVVRNDIPTIGNNNMQLSGDKLYAATGIGWDNPNDGWHHCPAGGGIFDKVYMEQREKVHIKDIFVKPDIDNGQVQVTVNVYSHIETNIKKKLDINIEPFNFEKNIVNERSKNVDIGYGDNYYVYDIKIKDYILWQCDEPYLYICQCNIDDSYFEVKFGMRKFHMDEAQIPKGTLYLNNKEIILRGANEMGHLQLCVIRNDFDQLIEDILIAKYCNMNCYRITQRPVQEEIYDYFDMLGMLNQVDMPLFGYMRKNKFFEGIKQAGEMERLVRNHPSVIITTYINEPMVPKKYKLEHRHLNRKELELFFDACDAAIYFENPDRVIKRVEGDYDPPTNKGLSDFHCYNMWYTNHAIPIGMLYKGYLPAIKIGWKTGCGEYGTEGLDNLKVMNKYYPSEWLPKDENEFWIPDKIIKAQTNTMHGDWYEEQTNINDWIENSQWHQSFATKLMTEAFRRRSDIINYTAIHLLIDAWPSGWMKTLLDVDRVPKLAYFAFKESLIPLKASLRCDRWQVYEEEIIEIEVWLLNDTNKSHSDLTINATIRNNDTVFNSYSLSNIKIDICNSECVGVVKIIIPKVGKDSLLYVDVELISNNNTINKDRFKLKTYPKKLNTIEVYPVGVSAKHIVSESNFINKVEYKNDCNILISSKDEYNKNKEKFKRNNKIFLMPDENISYYEIDNKKYEFLPIFSEEVGESYELKGLSFVACKKEYQNKYSKDGMSYWYNNEKGYIDHVATRYIKGVFDEIIAFSFEKPSFGKRVKGQKNKLPIVGKYLNNTFISFEVKGRLNYNPILDRILNDIINNVEEK